MGDVKRYDAKRMMHGDTEYTEIAEDPRGRWVSILDYDSLHSLLVNLAIEHARMWYLEFGTAPHDVIQAIRNKYTIRLCWNGSTFEEDTTK